MGPPLSYVRIQSTGSLAATWERRLESPPPAVQSIGEASSLGDRRDSPVGDLIVLTTISISVRLRKLNGIEQCVMHIAQGITCISVGISLASLALPALNGMKAPSLNVTFQIANKFLAQGTVRNDFKQLSSCKRSQRTSATVARVRDTLQRRLRKSMR